MGRVVKIIFAYIYLSSPQRGGGGGGGSSGKNHICLFQTISLDILKG